MRGTGCMNVVEIMPHQMNELNSVMILRVSGGILIPGIIQSIYLSLEIFKKKKKECYFYS